MEGETRIRNTSDPSWRDFLKKFSDFMRTKQYLNGDVKPANIQTPRVENNNIPGSTYFTRKHGKDSRFRPAFEAVTDVTTVVSEMVPSTSLIHETNGPSNTSSLGESPRDFKNDTLNPLTSVDAQTVVKMVNRTQGHPSAGENHPNDASRPLVPPFSDILQRFLGLQSKGFIPTTEPLLNQHDRNETETSAPIQTHTELHTTSQTMDKIMNKSHNGNSSEVPFQTEISMSTTELISVVHTARKTSNQVRNQVDKLTTQSGSIISQSEKTITELGLVNSDQFSANTQKRPIPYPTSSRAAASRIHTVPMSLSGGLSTDDKKLESDSAVTETASLNVAQNEIGDNVRQEDWQRFYDNDPRMHKIDDFDEDEHRFQIDKENKTNGPVNVTTSECNMTQHSKGVFMRLLQGICHTPTPLPLMFLILVLVTLGVMIAAICRIGHKVLCKKIRVQKDSAIEHGNWKEKKSLLGV